jgi:acetyl/propionyl-CoA carboxylase alpha subunit
MTDTPHSIDEASLEFVTKFFQDLIHSLVSTTEDRLQSLESSIENIEKQIASLVVGYGEQAVFVEALISQIAFSTEEARNKFKEDIQSGRKEMLEVMQNASKTFLADTDQNLASAVADVAESKLSDSDS